MDISPVSQTSASRAAAATSQSNSALSSDFNTFLRMLTAQMQNQDPLNPMDSTDFAVQLATFSQVEQQVRTNDLLAMLAEQNTVAGMAQLAGWVGMEARVTAPMAFNGQPIEVAPVTRTGATSAHLLVSDSNGNVVQRLDLPMGEDSILWAGTDGSGNPLPSGNYTFSVESFSGDDLLGTDEVPAYGIVREARMENGGTVLILASGDKVSADDVSGLRFPS